MNFSEIKKKAKNLLHKHFFRNIIVAFISLLIIDGGYTYVTSYTNYDININHTDVVDNIKEINKHGKSNAQIIDEIIHEGKKDIDNKSNDFKVETKRIIGLVVNELTKSKSFTLSFLNSINKVIFKGRYEIISIISFLIILYFCYAMFIKYPITVGKTRYFIEKSKYEDTKADRLFFTYRVKRSINISLSMLLKDVYQLLWNITIIGGIIKKYSYFLVQYVLAENPNISAKEAINLSKDMMYGYKWRLFMLNLSMLPWNILGMVTFGLSDILYYNPYKELIYSVFYLELKKKTKDREINNIDLLNDKLLLGEVNMGSYPDYKLTERFKSYTKIDEINYDRKYSILSLVLLFFTFSFIGWIWEVLLHLIESGIFVNRGTMHGPWLPIYGFGGVMILILLKPFRKNPWVTFLLACILCGIVEYFTGWYLETFKHMKWWDYTDYILNIKGRVCIEGLIVFGLGGCAFTYIFAPLIDNFYKKININFKKVLCLILIILYSIDLVYSHKNPNSGNGITSYVITYFKIPETYIVYK